jgi:hypothetical protein
MRINQAKRIFMNEADAGGGNGAVATPAAPAEPTAAPTAPVFDPDALVSRLMGAFEEKLTAHTNATNAALRKAGVFKQEKAPSESAPTSQPTTSAPSAQAGLSMADVEALLERENVVATRAAKYGLNEAQTRRLKSALSGVSRESFATEADSYLSDLGLAKASPAPQLAISQPAQPAPAKPNISDRGSASPVDTRDSEGVVHSRPLESTGHDVDALIIKHGREKGLQMFQEKVLSALGNVRIQKPRG